jgi:hypothetical protein
MLQREFRYANSAISSKMMWMTVIVFSQGNATQVARRFQIDNNCADQSSLYATATLRIFAGDYPDGS